VCSPPAFTLCHTLTHRLQAFHLGAHTMGSSSSHIPLYHTLEAILIRPFKEIANRLAYIWSRICLPNPLRLSLWDILPGRGRYSHYQSRIEEQRWWDESTRTRGFFASSDARHGKGKVSSPECLSPIPLVMSYVPRLLPQYRDRDHCRLDDAANECELTLSTYRKWHRLVFPHEVRTTTRLQVVMCPDRLCRVHLPDARH